MSKNITKRSRGISKHGIFLQRAQKNRHVPKPLNSALCAKTKKSVLINYNE